MKKSRILVFLVSLLLSAASAFAQQKVTGVVSDPSGQTLIGVFVYVEGTTTGVSTGLNGAYEITVPSQKSKLVFSCMGYTTQTIEVGAKGVIDVVLSDDTQLLDEIVVVGYGTQKKESSVAAIAQVKGDALARTAASTVTNALSGQIAGVTVLQNNGQPGDESSSILIRGTSSWSGSAPLVLVDGVEREYNQIDPTEIETISVLKDASATAVFGVRGANGVVLITTKRGRVGEVKVNVSSEAGFKNAINMVKPMNAYNTALVINEAAKNDGTWGAMLSDEMVEHYRTQDLPWLYPDTDWQDYMLKTGYQTKHSINVSGGTEFARVFASLGYLHDDDILKADKHENYDPSYKYDRYNFRFNADINVTKTTELSIDAGGYIGSKNAPFETNLQRRYRQLYTLGPTDGVPYYTAEALELYPDLVNPYEQDGRLGTTELTNSENPLVANSFSGSRTTTTSNLNLSINIKQDLSFITEGLNFKARASYNNTASWLKTISFNSASYKLLPTSDALGYKWVRRVGRDGGGDDSPVDEPSVGTDGLSSMAKTYYFEASLNYARKFGDHDVTGMLVGQRRQTQSGVAFPSYQQGLAARATYSYAGRYLFEGNLGFNGSEQFAPGHQYGFFPSFAAGYNLHNEPWFAPLKKIVPKAKIRASWGQVGSDAASSRWLFVSEYSRQNGTGGTNDNLDGWSDNYTPGTIGSPGTPRSTIKEDKAANESAGWEIATKQDLGFEFAFFKDEMLTLNIDLFNEHRDGILLSRNSIPSWVGTTSKEVNLGQTETRGYEIEAKFQYTTPNKNWYFFVKPIISFSDNRILYKDDPKMTPSYQKAEGYRINQYVAYHHTGYISDADVLMTTPAYAANPIGLGYTEWVDFTGDGAIDKNDMYPYATTERYPLNTYSLSLGFSYKNFDFDMLFQAATDVVTSACDNFAWPLHRLSKQVLEFQLDSWSPSNTDARYPSIHNENYRQHNNIADGTRTTVVTFDSSYIRLKNINIAYNVPRKIVKKAHMSSLKVVGKANNLFTWCPDYPLGDPEESDSGTNISYGNYPMTRTITFGVQIGF